MPTKHKSWRSAIPGVIVVAVLLALALFTLIYARYGALRGPTYTVYLPVPEARNVIPGTEVWLAGKRVGAVREIHFRPIATDTTQRLLLVLTILRENQQHVRRDSRGDIRSGGTLLGAQVVALTVGSTAAPALADGDTLRAAVIQRRPDLTRTLAELGTEFGSIATNVRGLREVAAGLGERIGMLERDREQALALLRGPLVRPPRRAGTLQLLMQDDELVPRLQRISGGIDSLRAAMATPRGTLGRMQHEQLLQERLASLSAELAEINRLLEGGYGTAGRLMHDRALVEGLESLRREIDLLSEDFSRWPERYLRF